MAFSRDGRYVVLAATDKTIRVMDVVQNREIRVIDLPASAVYGILRSDDRFLATSSSDLMGRVFEVATSKEIWHSRLAEDSFFPMAFMSNDKYVLLASGPNDLVVQRLLWQPRDLIEQACTLLNHNLEPEDWKGFSSEAQPKTCPNLP